jgi:histidinol-phosphate aminotransferase
LGKLVLDSAYAPLRLSGAPSVNCAQRDALWQLFSPNKALGLTGVRAAYAIAPLGAEAALQQLEALASSWPVGAHGVAMLLAWTQADSQRWLKTSLQTLAGWKRRQVALLDGAGWTVQPSHTPFFCARPPEGVDAVALCAALRAQGIKLRDATSFGLPGWVRLGTLPPEAQDALHIALKVR